MLSSKLKDIVKKQEWKDGSTWEFDWYIDLMFCHAMAFGENPIKIAYFQPVLDDEFLTTISDKRRLHGFENFFNDKERVLKLINRQKVILEDAVTLRNKLKLDLFKLNYDNYYKIQYDLSLLMASVSVVFDKLIEIELDLIAKSKNLKVEMLSNYVIERSSVTALNKSNVELMNLYKENTVELDNYFKNKKKISKKLQVKLNNHVEKYGWINTGERGKKSWTTIDFLKQLKNLISSNKANITDIDHKIKTELENLVNININDNIASDLQTELDYLFQKHLKLILGNKYDEKIIEQLSFEQIKKVAINPEVIHEFTLPNFNKHRLAYPENNNVVVEILSDDDYKDIKGLLSIDKTTKIKINGRSACQGMAEGYVKIVKNLKDLNNFKDGFILVAEKTQPSYVMTMKKARAIVTDIGGITSHAAIVAREFNIPTVVATTNATKQLKDGDFVRVDAFTGSVIKLN